MDENINSNISNPLINNPAPLPTPAPHKNYAPLWVIIAVIVFSMLVAIGGYFLLQNSIRNTTQQPSPSLAPIVADNLTVADINNATYTISGTQAQFIDGKFHTERNSTTSADQGLNAVISSSAFGDINADGKSDAVVITEYGMGSSSVRTDTLQVLLNVNDKPKVMNTTIPGRPGDNLALGFMVISIDATGLITLQLAIPSSADVSVITQTIRTYRYTNGTLVEDQIATWKMYTNTQYGFSFQYPANFNTTFASFSEPPNAMPIMPDKISKNGCYISTTPNPASESLVTINGMQFCLSVSGDVGAGQAYHGYYYTILRSGNYITLSYIVHTSNGCGVYVGTPNYQSCVDFGNNYDTLVVKPIQDSVATLKFTK